ncbi:hypothetical protein LRM47_03505 [Candidatus Nanosynbacter sp. TM7-076]|uniref:hypothetical protein n=1 Tax=Candidatus Nanosynbacter sp. TM7-076 TaxID=2902629 RepID=UPI001FB74531|nr:hypothetical protein [Candidatus Nanosynbacter sp. TM7-076]MCJ1968080.1 hypothetical protein [Candidatus Nanosynbacter sp. TM7-076]
MEKPKPAQNHEQERPKTLEDYAVKTFPVDTDPDNARRPLTVIRSGQDGEGVKYDRGWNPIGMSVVCDTDSEEGIGPIKLLMEAYKLVGTDIKTEFVPLEDIQGLNEDYIKYLYGKTPKEMIEEAKQIWRQKHPDSMRIESLAPGVGSDSGAETPSNGLVEDNTSDHEKPLVDEVSPAMGSVAVEATGIKKPITNKVEINEPVRGPVKTNETGVGSPALRMTKEVLESIGAIKVNDSVGSPAVESAKKPAEIDKVGINPADLVATEPVKKPVETDKASAAPADLPAAKSVENPVVEKSMETNEANADMLLEDFKSVMNDFEKDTEENNGKFFAKVQYITGELDRFRGLIKYNPTAAMNDPVISEMITSEPDRIRNLEDSRAEDANEFKNNIKSLLESLKSKIENDDERRRLVKITEYVGQMGKDNVVLGDTTNNLLDKLIRIRRYIEGWQNDRWGADGYKSNISQVIGEIISDLSTASGHRQNIVDGIKRIKSEGYYQER